MPPATLEERIAQFDLDWKACRLGDRKDLPTLAEAVRSLAVTVLEQELKGVRDFQAPIRRYFVGYSHADIYKELRDAGSRVSLLGHAFTREDSLTTEEVEKTFVERAIFQVLFDILCPD